MTPMDLSGSSNVCFFLQHGDRLGQQGLFHLEALERRGGKLKTGFARFLETVKQAGGLAVRERGRECDREHAERPKRQTWR